MIVLVQCGPTCGCGKTFQAMPGTEARCPHCGTWWGRVPSDAYAIDNSTIAWIQNGYEHVKSDLAEMVRADEAYRAKLAREGFPAPHRNEVDLDATLIPVLAKIAELKEELEKRRKLFSEMMDLLHSAIIDSAKALKT